MTSLKSFLAIGALSLSFVLSAMACSEDTKEEIDPSDEDIDGDGFTPRQGDCDDLDNNINPDAADPCDGIDQNCDGIADELFDQDNDNFTSCGGDCRDNDPGSFPGATEIIDGFDNDCDGIADNNTTQSDDDGDGFSEDQGDCNDNPDDSGSFIGPSAIEVAVNAEGEAEGIDNDCDGAIDEGIEACPTDLVLGETFAFAAAIDVCHQVTQENLSEVMDPRSQNILAGFGNTYVPATGPTLAVLSTGIAIDANDPNYVIQNTPFGVTAPHPDRQAGDPATIQDLSSVTLNLLVPSNANSFSFDFNFMSLEFPEFVGLFDDTFLALLESEAFRGNVSFDSMGNRVSINVGFFDVCEASLDPACTGEEDLIGTGFEVVGLDEGGGTGWLTTTAPVIPGEKIRITFLIYDEGDDGDDNLNSNVLIDNFRWGLEEVDGPITVD